MVTGITLARMSIAILYAIGANFFFALASMAFTSFSKQISVAWTNLFKASIAGTCFILFALSNGDFIVPEISNILLLAASGILGLCIGDMFLLKSYTTLGPGRTLILFSFHPIFTGTLSYFLFDQGISLSQCIAIGFMMACIIIMGSESMDKTKKWSFIPLLIALLAIVLDASGVILTRLAFEREPMLESSMANAIRCFFCVFAFMAYSKLHKPIALFKNFEDLKSSRKALIVISCFFGTFVSLLMYLKAVKIGHIATISAISATGPLWAAFFEFVFFKQKPSKQLYATFGMFAVGMVFLNAGF